MIDPAVGKLLLLMFARKNKKQQLTLSVEFSNDGVDEGVLRRHVTTTHGHLGPRSDVVSADAAKSIYKTHIRLRQVNSHHIRAPCCRNKHRAMLCAFTTVLPADVTG